MSPCEGPVLEVDGLVVEYRTQRTRVRAVRGVDLQVRRGQALAIVGESGSGKTATMLGALGLLGACGRVVAGAARLNGQDMLDRRVRRHLLGREVGVIFQDPLTSLHPSMTIAAQLVEGIRLHDRTASRSVARRRAIELLDQVGVPRAAGRIDDHPHQWSGGMRQRAMIAMAIAHRPSLLVADEPTTALDVTVQAQILELLASVREEFGMAVVLITHDLGVVAGFADEVAVMYHGRIVEQAPVTSLFTRPWHPYTAALLASTSTVDGPAEPDAAITGTALPATVDAVGCAYAERCPVGRDDPQCTGIRPPLAAEPDGRSVACHHPLTGDRVSA